MSQLRFLQRKHSCCMLDLKKVTQLPYKCNSKNICETILHVMNSRNLNIMDIVCVTTDGVSVMTGVRAGVKDYWILIKKKPVSIHCIAYRLTDLHQLASPATDKIPYLKKYQAMIKTIFKYFHCSPKHLLQLQKNFNLCMKWPQENLSRLCIEWIKNFPLSILICFHLK